MTTDALAAYSEDLSLALKRRDRDRGSFFATRAQRAELDAQFMASAGRAVEKVRTADAAQGGRTLTKALAESARLRKALADAIEGRKTAKAHADSLQAELTEAREALADAQGALSIAKDAYASHECMPLPQRVRKGPEWSVAAQVPPQAAPAPAAKPRNAPGSRSRKAQGARGAATHIPTTPSGTKPAESSTEA